MSTMSTMSTLSTMSTKTTQKICSRHYPTAEKLIWYVYY